MENEPRQFYPKLRKSGGSYIVSIPSEIIERLNLKEDDNLIMSILPEKKDMKS